MNRSTFTSAAVALALAACACASHPSGSPQGTPDPGRGKPRAPVSVEASLASGSARVTIQFDADAKDVRVGVHGTGGLQVTSTTSPLERASFARGETVTFDVTFTPGPGRSVLAVAVAGRFHGGGKRASVFGFAVGEPTPEQLEAGGTVVEGSDGERLKVVVPGQ